MQLAPTNTRIIVTEDYDQMSAKSAHIMADEINSRPDGVFGFATGRTPVGMYKELIRMKQAGEVSFSGVTAFNLDEYHPIARENPQSYYYFMKDNLFNHVDIDHNRVNIPSGECHDPEAECTAYEAKIAAAGGIDLQLIGIGLNGHIGFNEPADCFTRATNFIELTESTIKANRPFFVYEKDVPRHALTMGIRTIMSSRRILMIANGENKADIIEKVLFGSITPRVPASVLQLHRNVTIVMDKLAAAKIAHRL
ncbi:MAG: glucosamine-6-phosphate deaminase [Defluviitaleaceae bacterium]|nr:glucosamine-6-phosphate deaminase [Defluviitaleaceae bacterium]